MSPQFLLLTVLLCPGLLFPLSYRGMLALRYEQRGTFSLKLHYYYYNGSYGLYYQNEMISADILWGEREQ